jgi:hypothetical protein
VNRSRSRAIMRVHPGHCLDAQAARRRMDGESLLQTSANSERIVSPTLRISQGDTTRRQPTHAARCRRQTRAALASAPASTTARAGTVSAAMGACRAKLRPADGFC